MKIGQLLEMLSDLSPDADVPLNVIAAINNDQERKEMQGTWNNVSYAVDEGEEDENGIITWPVSIVRADERP